MHLPVVLLLILFIFPGFGSSQVAGPPMPTGQKMSADASANILPADWNNSGGNAGRNGVTTETGTSTSDLLWSGGRSSLIAWQPVTEYNRVFMIRQLDWPYNQPHDAYVVAMNLRTGKELWAVEIPYETGDWTPWIAGVKQGRLYVSRSGNGASVSAVLYALDVSDGSTLWTSTDMIDAGPYDGVVFAPDGDPVIASFQDIWRIDAATGDTVWHAPRTASVSGNCGGAIFGDALYVADATYGGHIFVRYDLANGDRLYESPIMDGFLMQNTPMVDPSGRIYLSRVQNNAAVDYFYSFTDTGRDFVENWRVAAAYSVSSEFGVGTDGSIYMVTPGPRLVRLDPETGNVLDETDPLAGFSKPRIAVDAAGKVFFSNGAFSTGRLSVYNAELTLLWDTPVTNINIGGSAIGQGGVLVVCGVGTDVRAYSGEITTMTSGFGRGDSPFSLAGAFRETTSLDFIPAESGPVKLEVFDSQGCLVRSLWADDRQGDVLQTLSWDGCDAYGNRMPAGVYLVKMKSGQRIESRKVRLMW